MRSTAKKRSRSTRGRVGGTIRKSGKGTAAATIRRIGDDWARHWNAGEVDGVVAAYAADAVYLPPHHGAVHGHDAIREYLKVPLSHGVSDLVFDVTYIKQQGLTAWDVGTYRMNIPQPDGTKREDHGKYLSVWRRIGKKWLLTADAWSSDLPPSA
jgi:ketosteroid isomerase-like protein